MPDVEDPKDEQEKRRRYEENVPSPRILKLAILAAAIIVIIAIVIYLKARHAPPALRDQLLATPMQIIDAQAGPPQIRPPEVDAANESPRQAALPPGKFQEAASWSLQQTASRIRS